jgi:hypothetical protein
MGTTGNDEGCFFTGKELGKNKRKRMEKNKQINTGM